MISSSPLAERSVVAFRQTYGCEPSLVAFAPGRVNLIGDHTDYNDGFALPCALQYGTVVAIGPQQDNEITACALDLGAATDSFRIDLPIARRGAGDWRNHIRGIAAGLTQFGLPLRGARLLVSGDVPQGGGLSSSASLGVALALALAALGGERAPGRRTLAKIAQWSEHHYVGCACGLMDQIASAFGEPETALLLDCRSLETQAIAFPPEAATIIVPSGVARGLVDSAYNERRAQCAEAATHYGVDSLRDLDAATLEAGRQGCGETVFRRARHVVGENARTLQAANAMARCDLAELGELMRASHVSLRDDFEVSVPAVDALVDCLNGAIGLQGGARITGGGFGGCVVAVVAKDQLPRVHQALAQYWMTIGMTPQPSLLAMPSAGARVLLP